uniref:Viral structural protein 6 n=1 Tax=Maypo virus TaxID=2776959 RepID=A0A8E4QJZ0_9REOV|nr:MAG: viral structural protein 6 [Maypo virus]
MSTSILYVDANFLEQFNDLYRYYRAFVQAVILDELSFDSPRQGHLPQAPALQALRAAKFNSASFDHSDDFIKEYVEYTDKAENAQTVVDPYLFKYQSKYELRRIHNQSDNASGIRFITQMNECHFAMFDADLARTDPGQRWETDFDVPLNGTVKDMLVTITPGSTRLSTPVMVPTQNRRGMLLIEPIEMPLNQFTIEFLSVGRVVYIANTPGVHAIPECDTVKFRIRMLRPGALLGQLGQIFPNNQHGESHAQISVTLTIKKGTFDVPMLSPSDSSLTTAMNQRVFNNIPVGLVFPPGMHWDEIVANYSQARQDNVMRLKTASSIMNLL